MKKLPKLHELLAIEGSLESQANTTRQELANSFEKKRHLFNSQIKTFYPSADGAEPVQEEVSSIQTTVEKEFTWISGFLAKSYDASLQVAEANTKARGSITLANGTVLADNVPATALLELEKRMNELLTLVKAAPTLDPAKGYTQDTACEKGVYKAREITSVRTRKDSIPLVLYEATDKHPAQVQIQQKDVPIGNVKTLQWSSELTPLRKSEIISRVEDLIRAVRQARVRANEQEVEQVTIGEKLLGYVFA